MNIDYFDGKTSRRSAGRETPEAGTAPRAPLTIGGHDIDVLAGGALQPPLVSFVVIAWNYGQYVGAAIDSIKRQDYPHFECLVINNGSTDDSAEVIARHVAGDSRFRVETLPDNRGQLGAALWSIDKLNGGFVTFVDADDVLFANYASTHLQVHMALPHGVGFTSSNVAEMNAAGGVLTAESVHVDITRVGPPLGLRPANGTLRLPTVSDDAYQALSSATAMVPHKKKGWFWGPGTSNMYRSSVLRLIRFEDGSRPWMRAADAYLNTLCHAFAGSALIGKTLSGYRLHDNNYYATRETLPSLQSGTFAYVDKAKDHKYRDIENLLLHAGQLSWVAQRNFWDVLDHATRQPTTKLHRFYGEPRVVALFVQHAPTLVEAFTAKSFSREVAMRFSGKQAWTILQAGLGKGSTLRVATRTLQGRLWRLRFWLRRKKV